MTTDQSPLADGLPPAPNTAALTADSRDIRHDTSSVIVWRTAHDDPDAAAPTTPADRDGLPARLAQWIVALYTRPGDTVADLDADTSLHEATTATGRDYLRVRTAEGATSPRQKRPVTLVAVRWPRPAATAGHDLHALLAACHGLLTAGGLTMVVLTTTADARDTGVSTHEQYLLAAAACAGLRHLHDIIWIPATDGRDSFTYGATTPDTTAGSNDNDSDRDGDRDGDRDSDRDSDSPLAALTLKLQIFAADVPVSRTRHEWRQ